MLHLFNMYLEKMSAQWYIVKPMHIRFAWKLYSFQLEHEMQYMHYWTTLLQMLYKCRSNWHILSNKCIVSCFLLYNCVLLVYITIYLFIWATWMYKQIFMIHSDIQHTTKSVWYAFCWVYLMFLPVTAPSHSICLGITTPDTGCSITRCWSLSQ